jgi:hypothetical protein
MNSGTVVIMLSAMRREPKAAQESEEFLDEAACSRRGHDDTSANEGSNGG